MEQVGSGSRHKGEDAKPFYRNVTVIRNCDFLWNDGQRYMPTQSKLAQIRKSSVLGQYKKRFEFDQDMSKEMVMRKVEETFPYLRNKSYAFKVVTSRPPKCMPTSRIWDGEMIKRNTQGNSALYILEDEETRKNDSSAYLDQPKSKRRNDELTSLDQSQKAGCELSSLGIGTLAISGQEKQPTSSGSNTRNSASHRASASRLALKEFSTAETLGAENGTLQGFIRLPQNQQMNTSNELVVASQRSHQLSSAEAMETSQQFCSNETAREGLNLWSEDPHLSHVTSRPHSPPPDDDSNQETKVEQFWKGMTDSGNSQMADDNDHTVASLNINQPTSSESSAALLGQNDMYPWNDSPMLDFTALLDIEMSDSLADNHSTTSGISGLDQNLSLDDLSPHEDEQFDFSVTPKKVPLQGAAFCRFSSSRALPGNVQSAVAVFELNLGTVEVRRFGEDSLIGERIPTSNTPGWVTIFLRGADDTELGETKILYYDEDKEAVERVIGDTALQKYFFRKYSEKLSNPNNTTASGADAQNSGICGSTEPVQMLCVLVYAAAEIGGQQFIEMIFNSSAGRVVYDRYKDSSALPEAIAREYGHEKTATFLEEITSRFSKEASEAQNYPQTIDWSELVRAAEEAQKQPGLNTEEESNHLDSNIVKYTGYLGDIDTSSNETCESGSSESEDNIPWATSKEMNYQADELSEIASAYEDQEFGIKKAAVSQSLMYIYGTGHFKREKVNSTVSKKVVLPTLEGWKLSLFQDSFIREASGLKHLRSLNRCDTSFFLGPEQESIQYRIITEYEKWCLLFKYMKYSRLHSRKFAAEGGQFVEKFNQETQAVMMGASFGCTGDLLSIQSTRELVTTSENPGLAVQRNSTQGLTKHCTSSDLWVLTCLCRPARNILFVYVADNGDILPQKAYFDDDRYELSIQYWQWQRYCSSLSDVQNRLQEMRKLSEEMRPEFGPTPLPTYNAKMLPQVQDKHMIRRPECCPTWLYTMIHQCWIYAPVERPPFIAIFDGISSRTLGAHSIVTWLSHCNQGRYLPPDKCQSEDPYLVNDKTNHPSFNVNVTDYRSARKEKLYEEQLHLDDEGNVIFTDKHPLVRGRKNNEKGLPLITGHPPAKIFYRISEGIADAQNEVNVETSSIYPPGCKEISRK